MASPDDGTIGVAPASRGGGGAGPEQNRGGGGADAGVVPREGR
jgi:hypothetical protein